MSRASQSSNDQPWSAYFALDGLHLDGLIGSAGILRFDWPEREIHIQHYEGISAAHNVSIAPNGKLALLGNFSQQIVLLDTSDPRDLKVMARQSTMYFEPCAYRLRSNTHHLWENDSRHFIGAVGENLYRFDSENLRTPTLLGPHRLENAHELRWDSGHRYILMGDLGPERYDVRKICVFDLQEPDPEKRARLIRTQNNVWHNCVHPTKPLGYAFTYSFLTDNEDYVAWSPAFVREYIYEIDLPSARIMRHFSTGAEFPSHLNSDVEVTADDNLYIASGGGHAVVKIPLGSFDRADVTPVDPGLLRRMLQTGKMPKNLFGALSRKATISATHYILQTVAVTGGRVTDGVYATRVSPDGKYIVAGHRGYNYLAVFERATMKKVYDRVLPFRRDNYNQRPHYRLGWRGHHLGIHHSEITARG